MGKGELSTQNSKLVTALGVPIPRNLADPAANESRQVRVHRNLLLSVRCLMLLRSVSGKWWYEAMLSYNDELSS
jgi:hypothetical protein